ncbi:nucleoside/nucleotide kinase family protein [Paenibacillus tuaregi]|uniref:ABC transporter permease n=1 Tax=Paenibacillus tuaregi TaxID=1816681 RepID=UPI0008398049|nr:ABC transporter permease [Paenibacillus tuaregi]
MRTWKLVGFEIKQQVKNPILLTITAIFLIFVYSEFSIYLIHYPVKNQQDIEAISSSGRHAYLYVERDTSEAKKVLQDSFDNLSVEDFGGNSTDYRLVRKWIDTEYNNSMTMDEVLESFTRQVNSPRLRDFMNKRIQRATEKIGTPEQINNNILQELKGNSFAEKISMIYADRTQVVASLLAIPLFAFLFAKDRRYQMSELIRIKPIDAFRYVTSRYMGCFIVYISMIAGIGMILNIWLCINLHRGGWEIDVITIFKDIIVYILPSLLFITMFIILIYLLSSNELVTVPICLIYIIYNITMKAFTGTHDNDINWFQYIIRNDDGLSLPLDWSIISHRLLYLVLFFVLLVLSCGVWKTNKTQFWNRE